MNLCPCGREKSFSECCQPLLEGSLNAPDPESLMRSRYAAFVHKDVDYLYETLDPQARFDFDERATREWAEKAEFLNLEILRATSEGNKGVVEFKATYKTADGVHVHHEVSKFRKQGGIWYFRDGKVLPPPPEKKGES